MDTSCVAVEELNVFSFYIATIFYNLGGSGSRTFFSQADHSRNILNKVTICGESNLTNQYLMQGDIHQIRTHKNEKSNSCYHITFNLFCRF